MGKVDKGKEASAKDIATKTAEAPDPSKAQGQAGHAAARRTRRRRRPRRRRAPPMPAKAPPEQTDLGAGKAETDDEMADAEVTEEQLAKSNEPEFTGRRGGQEGG